MLLLTHQPRRQGLALIELLTVVAILLLLLGIVIPMFVEARERSNRFHCQNNLREIGQALLNFSADAKGNPLFPDQPFLLPNPRPEDVPAAIFHLGRLYQLPPRLFVCPNTLAVPDESANPAFPSADNFSNVKRNLSYSMQNPYANPSLSAAIRQFRSAKPDFAIIADLNPGIIGEDNNVLAVLPSTPAEQMRWGNSNNHSKRGQNVLYADGRVEFADNPFVGIAGDNIYTTRDNTILDSPSDPDDNILLPTGN